MSTSFHIISQFIIQYHSTEQAGSCGNTSDLYSEGAWFESWTGLYLAVQGSTKNFVPQETEVINNASAELSYGRTC
jgi:hypothetical protein